MSDEWDPERNEIELMARQWAEKKQADVEATVKTLVEGQKRIEEALRNTVAAMQEALEWTSQIFQALADSMKDKEGRGEL